MYIQLEDFNSYMSPKNKDWLHIFVQYSISEPVQYFQEVGTTWTQGWLASECTWPRPAPFSQT